MIQISEWSTSFRLIEQTLLSSRQSSAGQSGAWRCASISAMVASSLSIGAQTGTGIWSGPLEPDRRAELDCRPGPQSVARSIGFPLPAIRPSPKGPRVIGASRSCERYPMTHEPGTDTRERARPAPERSLAPVVPRPAGDIPRRAAGRHKLRRVGWEDRPVCQSGRAGGCPRHRADRALP